MIEEYVVMRRKDRWWILQNGERLGPYVSMPVAISSAIILAKLDLKAGKLARVSVEDGEMRIVYDSSSDPDAPYHTVGT